MKKLALNLDELQVESFTTRTTDAPRGTVNAHESGTEASPSDLGDGCSAFYSCYDGCGGGGGYYSAGDTCGEYTEWVNCTYDYKHCGY